MNKNTIKRNTNTLKVKTLVETALNYFLEEQITLDIIARKNRINKGESKLWPTGKRK